ncbi:MAG TPA: aldehyde ferredoxin oxidoreductase C-terminal domain-containing protein [Dehalococcoidales bacterium]|nr:aldehyde ferredoxin oxidoreductase C-terminal domain-containing protein [Dehalococcoidales bacterium]
MTEIDRQTSAPGHQIYGYAGRMLRVDLTSGETTGEPLDEGVLRKYVGGAALGIKYLYDEVPPGIEWSDPANHLFLFSGPLGGTRVGGSGTIAVVTKGALTNGAASTQANGFFGAFLRFSGFDGIILQGATPDWVYLYIHDGKAELKDARHLIGKDTFEVERAVKDELRKKEREISVLSIGPAGENLVRFACIAVDTGHAAAHNGVGAVMGSKKLKAIAVERGRGAVPLKDKQSVSRLAREILANTLADKFYESIAAWGTLPAVITASQAGFIPNRNYTTSIHDIAPDKLATYSPQSIRERLKARPNPCWACASKHCHLGEITEGKYAGRIVEEPEYEGLAGFSALVGIDDVTTTVVLANQADRLGMDVNEVSWTIAWVIECYEKGILTRKDTDGLDMTWGNGEAIMAMLVKIARRQGFGNILADGVMRAARHVGGKALELAIHTGKGNTPRSHDHRVMWLELFDTCVSNTGTLETQSKAPLKLLGLPETYDSFDPMTISTVEARIKGAMIFEDSMVTCRFQTATALELLCRAVNAATGWDMDFREAMTVGLRAVNLARAFNLRAGIGAELDAPSPRYGSTPRDGLAAGRGIASHWDKMLRNYYKLMGWDEETGKPLPPTLTGLGLDDVIPQLWP